MGIESHSWMKQNTYRDPREDPMQAKADEDAEVFDAILSRRQKKLTNYGYVLKVQFMRIQSNRSVVKDIVVKMGCFAMMQREDEKRAPKAGLQAKRLTKPGIEQHLGDFGIDPGFASHMQLNSLSWGDVTQPLGCKDFLRAFRRKAT